jgi:uncharacterized protein (TIGR02145 family)
MKTKQLFLFLCLLPVHIFFAQDTKNDSLVWTLRNLDVAKFSNGVIIPQAKTDDEWAKAATDKTPAWCFYKNDPANGKKYGRIYNWYAVNDPRGLAPKGWHVASDEEWNKLIESLGGISEAGKKLKALKGWSQDGNGTNQHSFSVLPGGFRLNQAGTFNGLENATGFWTSTDSKPLSTASYSFTSQLSSLIRTTDNKGMGYYVRCVKDK